MCVRERTAKLVRMCAGECRVVRCPRKENREYLDHFMSCTSLLSHPGTHFQKFHSRPSLNMNSLKKAEPASAPPSRVAASCPLQAIPEQATLEDSPHVGQSHRRVHVLALQPLPTARARSAVRPASSQRLRGTLRRQQPSSERRRRSRSPAACARYVTSLDPRTRQNGRQASSEPVRAPV